MARKTKKIVLSKSFKKGFRKRIKPNKKLLTRFEERILLFIENSNNPVLKDHRLTGDMLGFRSFSVTGDVRVIYKYGSSGEAIFVDIGTHNQVYR